MSEAEDKYDRFQRNFDINIKTIEENAANGGAGAVGSVFGRTGSVIAQNGDYTKAQVGLANVDNTSDIDKPISTAIQNVLNDYALESSLSDVAITGSYDDLIDKPTIPSVPGDIGAQPVNGDLTSISGLSPANNDVVQRKSGSWTNRTIAQLLTDLAIDISKVSGLQAELDLKSNLSSPIFTGTLTAPRIINPPVVLTDASTINTNAALGNRFRVTLAGNRTLANPTNAVDGQEVVWEFIQDGTGSRTITLGSEFAFGTDITSVALTTTAGKRDFLGAAYDSSTSKWYVLAFARGY